jgi:hypothetical protein
MFRSVITGCLALFLSAGLLPAQRAADVEYITGRLREISASSLTLDTGDTIAIPRGARYFSNAGRARARDFEPGDHVTVEVSRDAKGQYRCRSITLNKKGTAGDGAEATRASASRDPAPDAVDVIAKARDIAFSYSETLPDYVVKQVTNRYSTIPDPQKGFVWQALDVVTSDLVYENRHERHTQTTVNGKPTRYVEHTGSWSEGEFANMLLAVFSRSTHTEFRDPKSVIIRDRPAWRYEYSVAEENSTWTLQAGGQETKPACVGSVWIDKATYRVLRIEMAARGLANDFPLDTAESSVDYGFITIAGQQVLLPVGADSLSCTRNSTDCTRDRTEYTGYRKFDADSSVTFDEPSPR